LSGADKTDTILAVTSLVFPFGRPVAPRIPIANGARQLFILGAYPSAFHVSWRPPSTNGLSQIKAVAVDNEPEPFWTGADEADRLAAWKSAVAFDHARFGEVGLPGPLNGSSGRWVEEQVLRPLDTSRADAWITDCLDVYCCSDDLRQRLTDTYNRVNGLPPWRLLEHPSEDEMVRQALAGHTERLRNELTTARPDRIVTLGNAALRVFARLVGCNDENNVPRQLSPDLKVYGKPIAIRVDGRPVEWLPLAHPAAPKRYQEAHKVWLAAYRGA